MKTLRYLLAASVAVTALTSCMSDPTEGVKMPVYDDTGDTETPVTPPDEPEDNRPDFSRPLDRGYIHLKGRKLESLNVISASGLTDAEKVTVSTLAGIAARVSGDQVYLNEGGPGSVWLKEMQNIYGIPSRNWSNVASLIAHYKDSGVINGYIVYRPNSSGNSHSVNVATSLCGILGGIAVSEDMVETIKQAGIETELADVTDKDERWLIENYGDELDKSLAADLKPEIAHHLRDYAAMTRSLVFYDENARNDWSWRTSILSGLDKGAHCFGYYGDDEWGMVNNASSAGVTMLPTDLAANLSTLSSVYDTEGLTQRAATDDATTEENVHYVTFIVSDGDNIAFNLWGMQSYIDSDVHGQFPLGMTISPALYDLAPAAMRWYFDFGKENDYFIAGPSGSGYVFPSKMNDADLDAYLTRLNGYVEKSGLTICNILDQGIMDNPRVYNRYLAQPSIDAIFYTGYGEKGDGRIVFSDNGKPVIEQRSVLWAGIDGGTDRGEERNVIAEINRRPADPHSPEGYTFVFVHCWTKTQADIRTVIDGLNPNVRVVAPDRFVALVRKNLGK